MRKRKMYKAVAVFIVLALLLTMQGMPVLADTAPETGEYSVYVEFTEEDRYDPEYYKPLEPVYAARSRLLRTTGEDLETYVVSALKNRETEIDISQFCITVDDFKNLKYFSRILENNMELFYVSSSYSYYYQGSYVTQIIPTYLMTVEAAEVIQEKMDAAVEEALSFVSEEMEDYEKALAIHDWLAVYCRYDKANYDQNTVPTASHSVYGPLANKIAVCDGYAKAYVYIMKEKLGIPCQVVTSNEMKHAWNMIQLGENYYHVDVTWDDPNPNMIGQVCHDYFLLSDAKIKNNTGCENHYGWQSDYTANDTVYEDALWKNSNGNIVYKDGIWYYVDSREGEKKLLKTTNILNGTPTSLYQFDYWYHTANYAYWKNAYSRLQIYRNKLLFNGAKDIYSMPFSTEEVTVLYEPQEVTRNESTGSQTYNIYGFQVVGDTMYYSVWGDLNDSTSETIYEVNIPGEQISGTLEISGTLRYGEILSADVELEDGIAGELTYQWYRDGEKIAGAIQKSYQLTAEDIGAEISVEVMQMDYLGSLKQSTDSKIQKAIADTPAAITRQGIFGRKLSSISLPEGYAWKEPDTVMDEVREKTYAVTYCLDDSLYEPLELTVSVTVISLENSEKLWLSADTKQLQTGDIVELQLFFENITMDKMTCQMDYDAECFEELGEEDILSEYGPAVYDAQTKKLEIDCENGGVVLKNASICTIYLTAKTDIYETMVSLEDIQAAYQGEEILTSQDAELRLAVSEDAHTWDEGVITKEATCTEKGEKQYTCTVCQETKTEELPATGHQHTEIRNAKEATCKEAGYTGDTYCKDCGELLQSGEEIPTTGEHSWDEGAITKEASCAEPGEKQYTCTVCQETKIEEIEKLSHQHIEVRNQREASCNEAGYSGDIYCTDCGAYILPGKSIPPTGHKWELEKIIRTPTAVTEGVASYTCTLCGAGKMVSIPRKEALKKGAAFTYQKLKYKVTKSGTKNAQVKLTGADKNLANVVIPSTVKIDGISYKVTEIDAKAFMNNKKIKSVVIGKNVKKIGAKAFYGCTKLKRITIKTKVLTSVGKKAVSGIAKNAVIQYPKKYAKKYKKLLSMK